MKIKLNCPVCDYQEIEGETCPNCDTDLSVIRMLKELPQVENPLRQVKIPKWQLGVALLLLIIGIGLGVMGSFIFLQPQLQPVSSPNQVSSDRLKLPVNHAPVTVKANPHINVGEVLKIPNYKEGN